MKTRPQPHCRSVAVRRWCCGLLREFTHNDAADAGGGGGGGGGDEADAEIKTEYYMNGNAYDANLKCCEM